MKGEFLWHVSVSTHPEAEDAVAEWLAIQTGQSVSTYQDSESGIVTVSAYIETAELPSPLNRADLRKGVKAMENWGLKVAPAKVGIRKIQKKDWAESWKRHFHPLEIGNAFLIKPDWSKRRPRKGQHAIILNPGLSFGTGQHVTTRFCLVQIARFRERWESPSFLDVGTGSGLLAIAAAKAGYHPVDALDNDPDAVRVARENARTNDVQENIRFRQADITRLPIQSKERYHLVCANLIADLLLAESNRIQNRVRPDGLLVLAGILKTEFRELIGHYKSLGWKLISQKSRDEWQSATLSRSS